MKKFLLTIIIIGLFFYLIVEMSRGVNCFIEYCYANRSIDIKKKTSSGFQIMSTSLFMQIESLLVIFL